MLMLSGKPATSIHYDQRLDHKHRHRLLSALSIGRNSVYISGNTSCVILLILDTTAALEASKKFPQGLS